MGLEDDTDDELVDGLYPLIEDDMFNVFRDKYEPELRGRLGSLRETILKLEKERDHWRTCFQSAINFENGDYQTVSDIIKELKL
jgi:hypothetical protein